jgi:hypothetical protein
LFVKGLNKVQRGVPRAAVYLPLSILSAGLAAIMMYFLRASNAALSVSFVTQAAMTALSITGIERIFEQMEAKELEEHLKTYNRDFEGREVWFTMRKIEPECRNHRVGIFGVDRWRLSFGLRLLIARLDARQIARHIAHSALPSCQATTTQHLLHTIS